ncbi:MAG: hypothetical protein JO218_15770 [Burkholderiales bacterium]|nr:hypothetical protein [Burkholderiales bacterium]
MQFDEVQAAHFGMISRDPFPHVLIERALLQMSDRAVSGAKFRSEVLAAAGWKHSSLISFGKYPEDAAAAFNRVRTVLQQSDDPNAILGLLKTA